MLYNKFNMFDAATKSVKWSGMMEILSRAVTPIIYLILARFLSPKDFGIFATAMIAISFSQVFWDSGLGKALIQSKEDLGKTADAVFWISFSLGVVIYGIIFFSAPLVAFFFNSPESILVLQILGIQVIIDSIASVQISLSQRELAFRKLFIVTFWATIIPAFISIPLAYAGYGVWSLVFGALASSMIKCIFLWLKTTWRPSFRFDTKISKKLASFGIWIVGESILAWFLVWGDSFIVGKYLGMKSLGIYRMACIIANMIFGLILNPILPVFYPALCIINNDLNYLIYVFNKINKILVSLSMPVGIGLFFVSPYIETVFLGNQWTGLNMVVGLIGLMLGITWMVGLNTEIFRAIGRPDISTKLLFMTCIFYFIVFIASAPHGLEIFTLSRLGVSTVIGVPLNVFILSRFLKIDRLYLWHSGKYIFVSALLMVIAILGYKYNILHISYKHNSLIDIFVIPILGGTTYLLALYLSDKHFIIETISLIKKSLKF